MPVMLNAWESDHCGDPLVAILSSLVDAVENWRGQDKPESSKLKEAAKDVGWFALGLASEISSKYVVNAAKAGEFVNDKKAARQGQQAPNFLTAYKDRLGALKRLKEELSSAFGGEGLKVIIFVDELDRCRPDYAVAYLETIKHIFDIDGMAFVLAIHFDQLAGSARALFGTGLDVDEYFRKFCHRHFSLPKPSKDQHRELCRGYIETYLRVEGKRSPALKLTDGLAERLTELVSALEMKPRQIQETFRTLGFAAQRGDKIANDSHLRSGVGLAYVIVATFSTARPTIFKELLNSKDGWQALCKEFVSLLGKEEAEWWIQNILGGTRGHGHKSEDMMHIVKKLGYPIESPEDYQRFIHAATSHEMWSNEGAEFRKAARRIEEVESY